MILRDVTMSLRDTVREIIVLLGIFYKMKCRIIKFTCTDYEYVGEESSDSSI